jgi:hypothetical protein
MPRKKKNPDTPREHKSSFHEGLEGFDIKVNTFGQMESTFEIDKLNAFLNEEKKKADAFAGKATASKEAKE